MLDNAQFYMIKLARQNENDSHFDNYYRIAFLSNAPHAIRNIPQMATIMQLSKSWSLSKPPTAPKIIKKPSITRIIF